MMTQDEAGHLVAAAQARLREAATIAGEVAAALGAVSDLVMWRSDAATRFRGSADSLARGLRELAGRCDDAAAGIGADSRTILFAVG